MITERVRYRATLAYDGAAYEGFQRQIDGTPTIQGAVEAALAAVTGQQATVLGAGRTDTGVHATGQVIAFDVAWQHSDEALQRALNANLPDDIALQAVESLGAGATFHPRFDAVTRLYRYRVYQAAHRHPLWRSCAWYVRRTLDGAALDTAAALLTGRHDFAAFGKPPNERSTNTVRTVSHSAWAHDPAAEGVLWTYVIEADAFLQHMVRRIVGTLVDVGRGALTVDQFAALLHDAAPLSAKAMAPPHGLTLAQVSYGAAPPPINTESAEENGRGNNRDGTHKNLRTKTTGN
ncbi:MAG: tRNA pseudouridine(38-40) synthase TruA [Chloroflexi bacterium]|nr:tRNA pseudouridine(38-40) synthase TruA [Chloroflexota bacterium]